MLDYPLAWHGMALNLPLMTAFHMKDTVPGRRAIVKAFMI